MLVSSLNAAYFDWQQVAIVQAQQAYEAKIVDLERSLEDMSGSNQEAIAQAQQAYEAQIADLQWSLKDVAEREHERIGKTQQVCLAFLDPCRAIVKGPSFTHSCRTFTWLHNNAMRSPQNLSSPPCARIACLRS